MLHASTFLDRPEKLHRASECYDLVEDLSACPSSADHLRVRITRTHAPADDAWTQVRCQLAL